MAVRVIVSQNLHAESSSNLSMSTRSSGILIFCGSAFRVPTLSTRLPVCCGLGVSRVLFGNIRHVAGTGYFFSTWPGFSGLWVLPLPELVFWLFLMFVGAPDPSGDRGSMPLMVPWGDGGAACCTTHTRCCPSGPCTDAIHGAPGHNR